MAHQGELKKTFGRTYVYLNPDVSKGPYTYRLSNIPGEIDPPSNIENIYTIAPIQHTETTTTANLYFSIEAIDKFVNEARSEFSVQYAAKNLIDYAPYPSERAITDLETVRSVRPVESLQQEEDVVIWFDMNDLEDIDTDRAKRLMQVTVNLPYNSRSITSLTATNPLSVSQQNGDATVSFDITSLPDA